MHGEKVNSISGKLTVLHEVGVVRWQDAWSDRSRLRRYTHSLSVELDWLALCEIAGSRALVAIHRSENWQIDSVA